MYSSRFRFTWGVEISPKPKKWSNGFVFFCFLCSRLYPCWWGLNFKHNRCHLYWILVLYSAGRSTIPIDTRLDRVSYGIKLGGFRVLFEILLIKAICFDQFTSCHQFYVANSAVALNTLLVLIQISWSCSIKSHSRNWLYQTWKFFGHEFDG